MTISIIPATEADAADILALQKLAYLTEAKLYDDYSLPPLLQTLDEIILDIHGMIVLKAESEGRIVGSVRGWINDGVGHIGRLIVQPEMQNQQILLQSYYS